ncbi:diaminopimelate epimerase [bacterium]|nr:diaminopimelate epimerase [bacterium]
MRIPFVKMSGAGNDMILVDHRDRVLAGREGEFARQACDRRFGIGADGVILLEPDDETDFLVRFFNPDGGEYGLCGNGARCMPHFAAELGLAPDRVTFRSDSGRHVGEILGPDTARVELPPVRELRQDLEAELEGRPVLLDWGDIGVPHAVHWVADTESVPVDTWGAILRRAPVFGAEGSNVSFVEVRGDGKLRMRTFERGVEGETWACASGAAVAASLAALRGHGKGAITVDVRGGRLVLTVPGSPGSAILLEGPVHRCCEGVFDLDRP